MPKPTFTISNGLSLVAATAILISWFSPGTGASLGMLTTNDANYWPRFERLETPDEYVVWYEAIPDNASWATAPLLPADINFSQQDYVVAPLEEIQDAYVACRARMGGAFVFLRGRRFESGPVAQKIIVPSSSRLIFHENHFATFMDAAVVVFACFIATIGWLIRKPKSADNKRMNAECSIMRV